MWRCYKRRESYGFPGLPTLYTVIVRFYLDRNGNPVHHSLDGPAAVVINDKGEVIHEQYLIEGRLIRKDQFFEEVCKLMARTRCPLCRAAIDIDLDTVETDTIQCPVCGETTDTALWRDANRDPYAFFDAQDLCDCGGEFWYTISNDNSPCIKCDRCGKVRDPRKGAGILETE